MSGPAYGEAHLERIERERDPAVIPDLVRTIRQQQHDLDQLRLSLDVARRELDELRATLMRVREK